MARSWDSRCSQGGSSHSSSLKTTRADRRGRNRNRAETQLPKATFFDLRGSFGHQFPAYFPKTVHQGPSSTPIFISVLEISKITFQGLPHPEVNHPETGPSHIPPLSTGRLAAGGENWSPSVLPRQPPPRLVHETERELAASAAQGHGDSALCRGQ